MTKSKERKTRTVTEEVVTELITPPKISEDKPCNIPDAKKYKITLVEGAKLWGGPGDIDKSKVEKMIRQKTEQLGNKLKAQGIVNSIVNSFQPDVGWTLLRKKINFEEIGSSNIITDTKLMRDYYFKKKAAETYLDETSRPPQRKFVVPRRKVHRFKVEVIEHHHKQVPIEE